MNSGLDKLKEIGAQKIYEQTHISKEHVQAIIHNSFEGLNKVQILGFISILEREYGVDLSEIRDEAIIYFDDHNNVGGEDDHGVFISTHEKKSNKSSYIFLGLLIILGALYYTYTNDLIVSKNLDDTIIEDVKENVVEQNISNYENSSASDNELDVNSTLELNTTKAQEQNDVELIKEVEEQEPLESHVLKVIPRSKVWMGYIELDTNKHHQKIITDSFELDTTKDWLIVFGHANLDIEIDGQKQSYREQGNIRFLYQNGKLEKIPFKEFKKLNRGNTW